MNHDPYEYFRVEARDLLGHLDEGILSLERNPAPDVLSGLLRAAHTLKGAARVVKLTGIAADAHAIEDVLSPHRDAATMPNREEVDSLLGLVDHARSQVASLSGPEPAPAGRADTSVDESVRTLWTDSEGIDDLLDSIGEIGTQLGVAHQRIAAFSTLRHQCELLIEQGSAETSQRQPSRRSADSRHGTVRGERLRAALVSFQHELTDSIDHATRELGHARDNAEQLRLVPAKAIFTALDRAVRDVAVSQNKRVVFEGRGGDLRLGPRMLREVHHALLHVVRNAVAHGIESEAERRAAGKPPTGTVSIDVHRRGPRIAFTCRDDGAGFDLRAVRRAVRDRYPQVDPDDMDTDALLRTLLRGGISTAGAVTDAAGRGVGLDVLREAAARVGGEVNITTGSGGATVELVVPVLLASLDALLVESAAQTLAIPLDAVRRTTRVRPDDIARTASGQTITIEGQAIPYAALSSLMTPDTAAAAVASAWPTVIIDSTAGCAAIGVDRLLGVASVVVRPLPAQAPHIPLVAGVWLDAAGHPQLVTDPDTLVTRAGTVTPSQPQPSAPPPPILVVDDSLTTRMLEQSILESAGYTVDLATNGEEALRKARDTRYGLFLVDVEMPLMDGFTFVEKTRADPVLSAVPAILVTSLSSPEDRRRGDRVGASAYLVKSEFDQNDLLHRVQVLLEQA